MIKLHVLGPLLFLFGKGTFGWPRSPPYYWLKVATTTTTITPGSLSSTRSFRDYDNAFNPGPQNYTNASALMAKSSSSAIHVNENYKEEVVPVRSSSSSSSATATKYTTAAIVDPSLTSRGADGGQCWVDIGKNLQAIGTRGNSLRVWNPQHQCLQEAGQAFQDIGYAWQSGDWEAVTYAALDASQTMELVARSMNNNNNNQREEAFIYNNNNNNELQKAFAGVAVELKCLSEKQEPQALNLQGLSLRLYQASRNIVNDPAASRKLKEASHAAQSLAKSHGAKSYFLPRRFQLWWRNNTNAKHDEGKNNDDDDGNDGRYELHP